MFRLSKRAHRITIQPALRVKDQRLRSAPLKSNLFDGKMCVHFDFSIDFDNQQLFQY